MRDFLAIYSFFSGTENRTVDQLSSVYSDKHILRKAIESIIKDNLNAKDIKSRSILIKPNWVKHSSCPLDDVCLRTHDNFILATLQKILTMSPSKVVIGDAPIQGCLWDLMLSRTFVHEIKRLSEEFNIPIQISDLRRRKYNVAENSPSNKTKPLSEYVIFNLGKESLLEAITSPGKSKFRVTNYDPDRMRKAHESGIHKYCITKEFFDADIVISLPKIKTHQKTGITGALKNIVGINGDKDFLPHHRIGGTKMGGDCYPGGSRLRYWSELLLDQANRFQGQKKFWFWQKFSSMLWWLSMPGPEHQREAGWYGNDTSWRMVLDLNKIALYGKSDGSLSPYRQRQIYSLCDGIIAGQGDGPLDPSPFPLGVISFTNGSLLNDRAMAILMGLPVDKIPLLNQGSEWIGSQSIITLNGEEIKIEDLQNFALRATPPRGWLKYFANKQ